MRLTWYGHACFLLETQSGSVAFDPYAPGSVPGLELPELRADLVLCSHEHSDHFYSQGVKLTGREPELGIQRMPTYHDGQKGGLRGKNLVSVVEAEGLRIAHLGDLGHMLSREQIESLGRVDVLLIPVGGHYTIDAATAWELAEAVGPGIIVPMHYRGEGFGFNVIAPVEDFLALAGPAEFFDTNLLELDKPPSEPFTAILKCPHK